MTEEILVDEHVSSLQESIIDPDLRVELLERNLRYIQQQHETTLLDLHNEINRLQQENRDLHYQLINNHSLPSSEQKERNTDQVSSSPTPDKCVDENHIHLEQKIDELEKELIESEENNKYLMHKIELLNKISSSKPEVPHTNNLNTNDNRIPIPTTDNDYQHLVSLTYEKQQQHLQIAKLRSVLVEILNTERLSIPSKILLRDSLTSTNISEMSMSKTTTTPVDMLFTNEKQQQQQRLNASPTTGRTLSFRQSNSQHRPVQKRVNLPRIIQENSSPLFQNPTDVVSSLHHSLSPAHSSHRQNLVKVGETPIARRERRTQELQKNRLKKTLYH